MNFKKIIPHLIAIGVFVLLACVYFSPIFNDYSLKQGDIQQFRGMEKEIVDANLVNDQDALWTNSMFGGMPAYQINVKHPNNFMVQVDKFIKLGLPRPVGLLFMAMLGFYIFALCLRVNPWLSILGAIAFGFSTINILYIGAGHVTKVNAIAYMAPALGGLILAFRGKWLIGSAVFALFFALNLSANHLQMTYYLAFLLAAVAIGEAIRLLIKKEFVSLGKVVAALGIGATLAIMPSWGNLSSTLEYSKYTTRGATDLTLKPKGDKTNKVKDGLETNYILEYNYGKGELLSIIAPNAKGERGEYLGNDEDVMMNVDSKYAENIGQMNRYWGGQRMSGGAFYFGVLMLVFALFGLVFLKDAIKWPFLVIAILALLLASNDPGGMNDFFINKVPLYNKFRDSKMILVLLQVMIPAMAVLFLDKLFKKEGLLGNKKAWLIGCGVITLVGIILYAAPSISGSMLSKEETNQFAKALEGTKDPMQADFIQGLKTELINVRTGIYQSDFGRAIGLIILGCGLILLSVYTKASTLVLSLIGIVAVTADNMSVSKRYLNNEDMDTQTSSWEDVAKSSTPYLPEVADMSILNAEKGNVPGYESKVNALASVMGEHPNYVNMDGRTQRVIAEFGALNLNSDYRVLSFANTFNETGTSYFHKSIGGYHGAKLKRFQELVDFHLSDEISKLRQEFINKEIIKHPDILLKYQNEKDGNVKMQIIEEFFQTSNFDSIVIASEMTPVMNMLNTNYFVTGKRANATKNLNANGAAWFVGSIKKVNSSNDEMRGLGKLNTKETAIVNVKDTKVALKNNYTLDSTASIKLTKYGTNELTYTVNAKTELPAIFSEIYYPEGWNCYADGKQIEPFRADYLLRGAVIPAGTKTVIWKFEPQSFYTASKIALIGSLLLLLSVAFILGKALMASLKEEKVEVVEN
jgi:hypothetical protein